MLLFAHTLKSDSVRFVTKNEESAFYIAETLESALDISVSVKESAGTIGRPKNTYTVSSDQTQVNAINSVFNMVSTDGVTARIPLDYVEKECCKNAFLKGAFLSAGFITDPNKGYHLEITTPRRALASDLTKLFDELGLKAKKIVRKSNMVVYFKESEAIEDILNRMGAQNAAFEMMNVKILKTIINKTNRVTNCETANIDKTVTAATKQAAAIEKIIAKLGWESLPEELRELAGLRLAHPEMSLRELAGMCSPKLTRSGVNHRLERIMRIADKL